ncbi:hypothetical protein M9Y10_035307 [Tritrichomonas musculus]|uniref:HMG box domain-containing protein n=1 Tax=Tritrichomonas musculus TaxID=1915356 RepID=A0ABR2KHB4_9EUKA
MEIDKVTDVLEDDKTRLKRPPNAYFLYCQEQRPILKEQYPDKLLKEINKILGDQWKNLAPDEQNVYKSQAMIHHQQFREMHPDYHYERVKSKKIPTVQLNMDPTYQCNLEDFVTDKYTIDQIRNFLKPGETTLNYQYTDDFTHT